MRLAAVLRAGAPVLALAVTGVLSSCGSPAAPGTTPADFVIDVVGERFVVRLTDPAAIALAEANLRGANTRFPLGAVRHGDGGFNQPWSWHLDPADTTFVEVAVEVCDGRPSYLETHIAEYPVYCPWGGHVVARR